MFRTSSPPFLLKAFSLVLSVPSSTAAPRFWETCTDLISWAVFTVTVVERSMVLSDALQVILSVSPPFTFSALHQNPSSILRSEVVQLSVASTLMSCWVISSPLNSRLSLSKLIAKLTGADLAGASPPFAFFMLVWQILICLLHLLMLALLLSMIFEASKLLMAAAYCFFFIWASPVLYDSLALCAWLSKTTMLKHNIIDRMVSSLFII